MPRAEAGSSKAISNKMKSKGLTRLRWYCQACEKACRDANGFKCHVQSESHVRTVLLIGEDPKKYIQDFSNQFQHDFLQLLRTAHGEKSVHMNHFYQEFIADKNHIHMNATKWPSLTEFAKHLGREGICRVEDTEKGLHIAWIDNSPEALRRQDAIRKKERQDKGDEERAQRQLEAQVERARLAKGAEQEVDEQARALQRTDGEKIKLNFGAALTAARPPSPPQTASPPSVENEAVATTDVLQETTPPKDQEVLAPMPAPKVSMSFGGASNKPKNVLAEKKNALAGKKSVFKEAPKKISEQERIMKEEMAAMAAKRGRQELGMGNAKRQKFG